MNKKRPGWKGEPIRHAMARYGIETTTKYTAESSNVIGKVDEIKNSIEQEEDIDIEEVKVLTDWNINMVQLTTEGDKEFYAIASRDDAVKLAEEFVEQDLREQPELFREHFIRDHAYVSETDKRLIISDEIDALRDDWSEEELKNHRKYLEDRLENDPINYFEELGYERSEILKRFVNIDYREAKKDAVRMDGPGHFLSPYDSMIREVKDSDIVYWRHN